MKFIKKVIKYIVILLVIAIIGSVIFYGNRVMSTMNTAEYIAPVFATTTPEVIIKSDFEELKKSYMESEAGQEVLEVWATQKALADTRGRLEAVEKDMLEREASL